MDTSIPVAAGAVASVVFACSTLPMLGKAVRTKDLASYSRGNLVLANLGNAVYSVYVFTLPPGPIWLLHTFYIFTSALMLIWSLRYGRRPSPAEDPAATSRQSSRSSPCALSTSRPSTSETVIVGAGQAGLATGYHLQRAGRPFVILDGESRVGDGWRNQWDTLRLFSPGLGGPASRATAPRPSLVVPDQGRVRRLPRVVCRPLRPAGAARLARDVRGCRGDGYEVTTGDTRIECDNVVLCTGTFGRTPHVPGFADQLDPSIRQLHSSEYRRPSQLADGTVLVVGASHSGCDIAYETAATHPTVMVGPDTGQIPVPFTSPLLKVVFPVMLFAFTNVLTRSTPMGRKAREHFRHGGPRLRVQQRDLAERGVDWVQGRVAGVADGRPVLDDGRTIDAGTVVWCTGFRQAFDWVRIPVFHEDGWPREYRGEVDGVPGLFFCGMQFQYAASSMLIHGAGRDAAHVAGLIEKRQAGVRQASREAVG